MERLVSDYRNTEQGVSTLTLKKIDYAYKAEVIRAGVPDLEKRVSWTLYLNSQSKATTQQLETANSVQSFFIDKETGEFSPDWLEASKINHAQRERARRLRSRIRRLLREQSTFITLTFTDEVLQSTAAQTRRRYVTAFLRAFNCPYVGNIDFGKENGREHYHAVIQCDSDLLTAWEYGFYKYEKIRIYGEFDNEQVDHVKLAKYIAKLSNHAIKETTKRSTLIYSRE